MPFALHIPGKPSVGPLEAVSGSSLSSNHLFVTDHATKIQYLIDTDADLCTFPKYLAPWSSAQVNYNFTAENRSTLNTYGCKILSLNFGLKSNFTRRFVVSDIKKTDYRCKIFCIFRNLSRS